MEDTIAISEKKSTAEEIFANDIRSALCYALSRSVLKVLPMSVKLGLDSEKVGEVVNSGTGRSYASEFFIPRDLDGIYNEGYSLEKAYKDLVSAAEISAHEGLGLPMPVLSAATVTYQMALLKGLGKESKGAMIKVYEDLLDSRFIR